MTQLRPLVGGCIQEEGETENVVGGCVQDEHETADEVEAEDRDQHRQDAQCSQPRP